MTTTAADPVSLAQALIRCERVTPNEGGALELLQGVLVNLHNESSRNGLASILVIEEM